MAETTGAAAMMELFAAFFSQVTGEELSATHVQAYAAIVNNLRQQDREATV